MSSEQTELEIAGGGRGANVSSFGASLRGYWRMDPASGQRVEVLWGYSGTPNKKGGQGDVLIPFPGRVRGGRYPHGGRLLQLRLNDKDGPNAIHGFVRTMEWRVAERTSSSVSFEIELAEEDFREAGYPFSLSIRVGYSVSEAGLRCNLKVRNTGGGDAPVGAGFHPYFNVGAGCTDDLEARFPAEALVEFGPDLLPTGRIVPVAGTPLDFRQPRRVGDTKLNHCLARLKRDADGLARAKVRDPRSGEQATVWMDKAFDYLVVYTADQVSVSNSRRALAIEPMTCASDAFNRPEWGLSLLRPGETLEGSWGIEDLATAPARS